MSGFSLFLKHIVRAIAKKHFLFALNEYIYQSNNY